MTTWRGAWRSFIALVRGKERDEDGIERFVRNLTYVGGFGLASDTLAAAKWGRLGEALMGPSIGDMTHLAELIIQGQGIGSFFSRQPAAQAARAIALGSAASTGALLELIDKMEAKRPEHDEAISIEELITKE